MLHNLGIEKIDGKESNINAILYSLRSHAITSIRLIDEKRIIKFPYEDIPP